MRERMRSERLQSISPDLVYAGASVCGRQREQGLAPSCTVVYGGAAAANAEQALAQHGVHHGGAVDDEADDPCHGHPIDDLVDLEGMKAATINGRAAQAAQGYSSWTRAGSLLVSPSGRR